MIFLLELFGESKGLRVKSGRFFQAQCAMRWLTLMYGPLLIAAFPRFDPTALLRDVLIPADAAVGAIIYRLRASDPTFDYPLVFSLVGQVSIVSVTSLNCTKFNSVCQANVLLKKRLEAGRFYDFAVDVRNQRRESTRLNCSFRATNATTPLEKIFPGAPSLLTVSENARRNSELGSILARGNPNKMNSVYLELWGSAQFGLHQKLINEKDAEGAVFLVYPLDYEKQTVHHLTVLANDPWTNIEEDTRNIAGWPLLVAVLDEQDTPPVFTIAPPTTTISPSLTPGDLILKVHAEDGDRGNPREIRYGLVAEGNPFASLFSIVEETGELILNRPLSDVISMSHNGQPILLTVTAEEVRANPQEAPAQSSSVQLALIPPGVTAGSPTFGAIEYNTLLDENSPSGTVLDLPQAEINTQPGDIVTLELINNNGTFDISPSVIEGHGKFHITVHDPTLLDYEQRQSVQCYIIAKEVRAGNYTAKAKLTVLLNDMNDNPPEFIQNEFYGNVQEHAKLGTTVLLVEATDVDREPGSKIKYTKLSGHGSEFLNLDSETGLITVANSQKLDAEEYPVLTLTVEAADENGNGLTATATVIINLIDINDQTPYFEKSMYEFILNSDKTDFTTPAVIRAIDRDISPPNNELNYELIESSEGLSLNQKTGELILTEPWTNSNIRVIKARVWDGGIPRLSSECEIRIYPPDRQTRKMIFIVPGKNPNKEDITQTLRALTGTMVTVDRIRPYKGDEPGATYVSRDDDIEKSVVEATISFSKDSVVDVNQIQKILDKEYEENRYREKEIIKIKESSSGDLLWLLILFFLLLIIAAIILIICCLCKQCPLYLAFKRRKQTPEIEKVEKIQIIGTGQGQESKSVQVAEWFGRREAWTPEHIMVDTEAESLRRHEVERGSDRGGARRTIHRQSQVHREPSRDQLYIREGNADILRLITRGGEQRPVTLVTDQAYMADSGKDILMRRFIDQQQTEAAKAQVLLPNAVNRLQTEHELLEASLRQQNALLRQILMERERDLRLETQSLPAGTQTDQDAGTQTEPQYLLPPRRRVRSDNDQSDASDDELAIIKARAKRRSGQKSHVKRKIKTPIQEESELEIIEKPQRVKTVEKRPKFKQTKTSELRQKRAASEARSSQSRSSKSGIKKEVLREITASLEQSGSDSDGVGYFEKGVQSNDIFSDDSLEVSPRSEKTTDSNKHRYHSESDIRLVSSQSQRNSSESQIKKKLNKSQSHTDLTKISQKSKGTKNTKKRRGSRYMEWYNKGKEEKPKTKEKAADKNEEKGEKEKTKGGKNTANNQSVSSRLLMDTESSSRKKVDPKKVVLGPEHPLLQHSEHRFEAQYPQAQNTTNARRPEEDTDSGIALTRPAMAQKKSVFTIAYDDMHTSQLRPDSSSPPL